MKKSIFPLVFALISVLLLSGCPALLDIIEDLIPMTTTTTIPTTTTTTATTVPPTTTTTISEMVARTLSDADATSADGDKLAVISGGRQYIIRNNIIDNAAEQIVTYSTGTGDFEITQQAGSSTTSPVSFPSIFIGNNNGHATSDSDLSKLNSTISSIQTTWAWSNANATMADFLPQYELWFTSALEAGILAPEKILAIWLNPGSHSPSGSQIGSIPIAGKTWNVFDGGTVITYVATSSQTTVDFDLANFIDDAIIRGIISNSDYLHDVIAGFRIWSGGAGLASSNFSALVN